MKIFKQGIPISPSLTYLNTSDKNIKKSYFQKKRLLRISALCVLTAAAISFVAKILIYLINLVTNISFYGSFDFAFNSPANNLLGLWVIVVPAMGGLLVGLMALYGSKAIRGHGIPEAMEQILTNKSRIKPSIAFLKPISAAIAIGTGGPFGAEGPIIATGGAFGSTLGQLLHVTPNERKIILAAGATAGMSAIFGTPVAAIFLAIELLLFEFSPKAVLPVALACITGAAGHHFLFESGPVFPMPDLDIPSNMALGIYSFIGIIIGIISMALTKAVYYIEDAFEKLPVHWMWWPAIGGLAVGIIGFFAPATLGVGYENITNMLSGKVPMILMLSLCFFKFLSWAIALGSGTSGGTLAPLLTIGGASGAILGSLILSLFPQSGISVPMAALVGMSSMFAGASRAYLTSITFALEATMQSHALLPLLGACTGSYLVSFFLMENTIMTEKIARRGIYTPDSYEPDVLRKMSVSDVVRQDLIAINEGNTIAETREYLRDYSVSESHFLVVDKDGLFVGTVTTLNILNESRNPDSSIAEITNRNIAILRSDDTLSKAVTLMSESTEDFLPVVSSNDNNTVNAILTYKDVLSAYQLNHHENHKAAVDLSLKRQHMKVLIKGKRLVNTEKIRLNSQK
ncbi:H+/Cl- antiporter ClcA [Arcticibacter tournemirensis]|uniref:Chloride channel protein n=1 Tax=Arcticibacter tournemirensis TaxID=699437 RepID=A0A5M9H9E3_9SPHI|nr:chloride channel protein [Arcticibacter tournemirensis]KAA8482471.1 chloride channel protein [Arcticibacter tournemirensis]TQM51638.1 H+/Cl- antiporter ClcA [Arcticibacter tournemirensis]